MINFIVWIIAGALVGWAASIIMRTHNGQGLISDILVGIVGGFLGGYFLSPLFNAGTINDGDFSLPALLVSLGGAVLVLLLTKLFRNVLGYLVFIILAMGTYVYFNSFLSGSSWEDL